MKAGDAAFFCAVRTLVGSGLRPAGDVILTYVVGELQGGIGTVARESSRGCAPTTSSNGEPTDLAALTLHAAHSTS